MFKRIVVTALNSPESDRAVEVGISIAAESHASLHLILSTSQKGWTSGFADISGPGVERILNEDEVRSLADRQKRVENEGRSRGFTVSVHRIEDRVVESVLDIAREQSADLLVMGLHHSSFAISRLWSKIGQIAEEAPCCVLGVP